MNNLTSDSLSFTDNYFDIWGSNNTLSAGNETMCLNSTLFAICDTIVVNGYPIEQPELLPFCLIALILGLTLSKKAFEAKHHGYTMYSIVFAMTGIMMTFAGINDSILGDQTFGLTHLLAMIVDVSLTSSIALGFFFCGLIDIGWIKDKFSTILVYFIGIFILFCIWTVSLIEMIEGKASQEDFNLIYNTTVGAGCGGWVLIQLIKIFGQSNYKGFEYFVLAGLSGGLPFVVLFNNDFTYWLCMTAGCISPMIFWFAGTDFAIYYIYKYYIASSTPTETRDNMHNPLLFNNGNGFIEMGYAQRNNMVPVVHNTNLAVRPQLYAYRPY
jgi:uncharacterized membrane protein